MIISPISPSTTNHSKTVNTGNFTSEGPSALHQEDDSDLVPLPMNNLYNLTDPGNSRLILVDSSLVSLLQTFVYIAPHDYRRCTRSQKQLSAAWNSFRFSIPSYHMMLTRNGPSPGEWAGFHHSGYSSISGSRVSFWSLPMPHKPAPLEWDTLFAQITECRTGIFVFTGSYRAYSCSSAYSK